MKTMTINSKTFEVCKLTNARTMIEWAMYDGYDYDAIYRAYNRPSSTKVSIWHHWCDWVDSIIENGGHANIRIGGHSCNFFTIHGYVCNDDTEGEIVPITITYAHNRAFM